MGVAPVNTTDMIHCTGNSTFMRTKHCKGILLRAIMLTHVLHDIALHMKSLVQ